MVRLVVTQYNSSLYSMRISSYNVRSIKSNTHCVRDLCSSSDIICLQETWLPVQELDYLSTIDRNFSSYGTSPVDLSREVLKGRPYGGMALLYRKELHSSITRVATSDERLLCIDISVSSMNLRIINCYLPYDNNDNSDVYLTKLHCLMNDQPNNNVFVIGDFNAHPQSRFGQELVMFCNDYGYVVGDMQLLPGDTYTWVSDATGHTRWLDHIVCPAAWLPRLQHLHVDHDLIGSDHRALHLVIDCNNLPPVVNTSATHRINYSVCDIGSYQNKSERLLKEIPLPLTALTCDTRSCQSEDHRNSIRSFYNEIMLALISSGEKKHSPPQHVEIPGWNELVRQHHYEARSAYKRWRAHGKPRVGEPYRDMISTRSRFKHALKNCKKTKRNDN